MTATITTLPVVNHKSFIEQALIDVVEDVGAVYEIPVIEALKAISEVSKADYIRYRLAFKKANANVVLGELDKLVRGQSEASDEQSVAEQIVEFVKDRGELFCDQDNEPCVSFVNGGHTETWWLISKGFQEWLTAEFYRETGAMAKEAPLKDACLALSGASKYGDNGDGGTIKDVHLRSAKTDDGYAIDLCGDDWQSVRVSAGSWSIDSEQITAFRRTQTMKPLPVPLAPGAGNLDALWDLINCKEEERNLLLAYMVECFRPDTGYPVCEIGAEQGSGKSKAQSFIRNLIDPNAVNLRGKPKNVEDIFISGINSSMLSYENLSYLSDDTQDAFCVLATGGGFAGRTLYTNAEETAINVKRPIIMNGISVLATRQDLVDRLISISLDPITPAMRKTESELDALFAEKYPAIFTGLLDLFAAALDALPSIQIDDLPRMADFALLGAAVYQARGVDNPAESFMSDYTGMRIEAIHRTLDSSPIAGAFAEYLSDNPLGNQFANAQTALKDLEKYKNDTESWPKSAKGFADMVKRLSPAFRQIGIHAEVCKKRTGAGYPVIIKPIPAKAEINAAVML